MTNICFVCSNTVHSKINKQIRDKYKNVIGLNLSPDSQLCYVCSHLVQKLSHFKTVCFNTSLQYPALLSKQGPVELQKGDLEIHILCPDNCYEYKQIHSNKSYQFQHSDNSNDYNDNLVHNVIDDAEYINLDNDNNQYINKQNEKELEHVEYSYVNNDLNCNDNKPESIIHNGELNYLDNHYDKSYNGPDSIKNEDQTKKNNIKITVNHENVLESNDNQFDSANEKINICELKNKGVKKNKKKLDKGFKKIVLSLDKQKAELETNRKEKNYLEAEFKCYNCALYFLFNDTYQAHMMRHEESNGEYQCSTCTLRFATPASLRIHAASHSERYLCHSCDVILKPRCKKRHSCQLPLEPQSVACHLCGNLLKDANGLQQHLKRVHTSKSSSRRYACNVCGDSYTRQGALRTHMIKHINRKFHCEQCAGAYSSPYTLNQHKKSHYHDGTMHYCDTCGSSYMTRKSLLAHIRNHSNTTFECPICSRVCPNQKSLASHIQSVHSTSKEFTCSLCPARYTNRKSLVRHVTAHTKQKPDKIVICHLCGAHFKDNSKLNRHLKEVCNKSKEEQLLSMYD